MTAAIVSMKFRTHVSWLLLAGLATLTACQPPNDASTEAAGPSVLVILSDTLRAANLPTYGYARTKTPRLDALAAEGLVFEHHMANYPGTPISVSQMMSGRLMAPLLMSSGASQPPFRRLEEDLLILPKALREGGWRTGLVSAHPWFDDDARVLEHFDQVVVPESGDNHPYAPFSTLYPAAERFLEERAGDGERFFLYVHGMDTHQPYRFHPDITPPLGNAKVDAYDHQIAYLDHWVGRLLDRLQALGLDDNTIVVLTSDHGEDLNELGPEWWNDGHGNTLRRTQVHIPLILRVPNQPPRRVESLTRHIDLAPTLMRLLDDDFDLSPYRVDGRDLSPHLRGGPAPEPVTSLAFSWRYWAIHDVETETIFDQWQKQTTAYAFEPDAGNYPHPVALQGEADKAGELESRMRRRMRELLKMPNVEHPAGYVGVPSRVVHDRGESPTYDPSETDGRWFQKVWMLLEVAPGEKPPPLVLEAPWAPGRYQVSLRLNPPHIRQGFTNEVDVRLSRGDEPLRIASSMADERGFIDLGQHKIGAMLRLELQNPEGGVAIAGLFLRSVGGGEGPQLMDPEEEERLRALGYLE